MNKLSESPLSRARSACWTEVDSVAVPDGRGGGSSSVTVAQDGSARLPVTVGMVLGIFDTIVYLICKLFALILGQFQKSVQYLLCVTLIAKSYTQFNWFALSRGKGWRTVAILHSFWLLGREVLRRQWNWNFD
jgi:hypothetical protein